MADLNGINFNPDFRNKKLNNDKNPGGATNQPTNQDKSEAAVNSPQTNFKEANEVLNYMKNQATLSGIGIRKPGVQVKNHVTPEQEQRISAAVNKGLNTLLSFQGAAQTEFGVSSSTAQALAVEAFNLKYLQ